MLQLLRLNPGLLVWVLIFGIGAFVCAVLGLLMSRAGASPRPITWFAGFLLLVGAPQLLAHFWLALRAQQQEAPRLAALQLLAGDAARSERQRAARELFGTDADPDLVTDARSVFGEALDQADVARFAALPSGESVLLARFRGSSESERAWLQYLRFTGLGQLGGQGDSESGYAVTRPSGDRAFVARWANLLGVWTGPDDGAIRRRMAAGGFKPHRRAPLGADETTRMRASTGESGMPATGEADGSPIAKKEAERRWGGVGVGLAAAGLAGYLFLVALYFFKGSSWAASVPARPGAAPLRASELSARLEEFNRLDVPFRVERGRDEREWLVTWRYADGRWMDLARLRGVRRVFRIRLNLDEQRRVVRATDYVARSDWSVGRGGADFEWKSGLGIQFFQAEYGRVLGIQMDSQGRPTPELSYTYRFDLREMKGPVVAVVTAAGWDWRPVAWNGPKWLRWLTE